MSGAHYYYYYCYYWSTGDCANRNEAIFAIFFPPHNHFMYMKICNYCCALMYCVLRTLYWALYCLRRFFFLHLLSLHSANDRSISSLNCDFHAMMLPFFLSSFCSVRCFFLTILLLLECIWWANDGMMCVYGVCILNNTDRRVLCDSVSKQIIFIACENETTIALERVDGLHKVHSPGDILCFSF